MRPSVFFATICICLAALGNAHAAEPPPAERVVAIVGSRVIPMTGERVIDDATILVSDGVIRAVGAASGIKIPKGARVIDAQGMFLLPGLGETCEPSSNPPFWASRYTPLLRSHFCRTFSPIDWRAWLLSCRWRPANSQGAWRRECAWL